MATKSTTKSASKSTKAQGQKATTGAKVEKVGRTAKGDKNIAETEQAGLNTAKGKGRNAPKGGQQAAPKGGQQAPAAKGKGKGKAAPKGGQQSGQRGRASEFPLTTKVRAAGDVELRENSFAAKVSELAAKPITLEALIESCVAKRKDFFRTSAAAESADAARRSITIRVRDLIRSEYLVVA